MKVSFEASIYSGQTRGGISRIFNEVIPRLCEYPQLDTSLILFQDSLQSLPYHERLKIINFSKINRILRPRSFWKNYYEIAAHIFLKHTTKSILHTTNYRTFNHWNGRIITHVYDMIFEKLPEYYQGKDSDYYRQLKKTAILKADKLICISRSTSNDLEEVFPSTKGKTVVVPIACGDVFKQIKSDDIPWKHKTSVPFFLYVGERKGYKNFAEVIRAYSSWKFSNEFMIYVVGPDFSQEELDQLSSLDLINRVQLIKNVDDIALCYLYNQASALLHPSKYEGFGIPLIEAMSCGCPIIASSIPTTHEIADDVPVYFSPGQLESLISAFDQITSNKQQELRIMKGLSYVKRYSWDITTESILKTYESL